MKRVPIIGRQVEKEILKEALESAKAELVAVYGRRRVGKTFLIRSYYENHLVFELSGSVDASREIQLVNFAKALENFMDIGISPRVPDNWPDAFVMLTQYLERIPEAKKKVIFFDELPWLDTMHSGFLSAFDYFWNSWCSKQANIVVVICGSAASWMIDKIIYNKGGLHNRITRQIRLLPFTLTETKSFLTMKNIKLDNYQIAQLYMAIGGVPYYLDQVRKGKSTNQIIDELCFAPQAPLQNEFDHLYISLYSNADVHLSIIKALGKKRSGLSRNEIMKIAKLNSGGYLTDVLNELEESGFISSYLPMNRKSKDAIFRLMDEYSLFYLKFIEPTRSPQLGTWAILSSRPTWKAWSGYAFENLCLKHVNKIKSALQIGGVHTQQGAWYDRDEGAQIDLIIDRADRCINLCEIKFSEHPYTITRKYANDLQHKALAFKKAMKTNKTIFTTMITTFGLTENEYSNQYVDSEVVLDDLIQ